MKVSELRLKSSVRESIAELLNKQLAVEAHASAAYLSMSAWCYAQGLNGCGEFFRKQSDEEREHMMKMFKYITDAGALAVSPEIKDIPSKFANLGALLQKFLEMEIGVTDSYNNASDVCQQNKDYQTAGFLQWYLNEQREEEQTARRCLEIMELIGSEGDGLYRVDKEIHKLIGE